MSPTPKVVSASPVTFWFARRVTVRKLYISPISTPVTEPVDILFLGNSYYAFSIDPEVRNFIRSLDREKIGRIVNFGSAAMLNSTYKKVKAEADKAGIRMDEREFHCKGEFKGVHKGKPDADDLAAAAAFAKAIVG